MYKIRISTPIIIKQSQNNINCSFIRLLAGYTIREAEELKKCYKILNLPHDCDQEQLRSVFLELVKKYHPDSGSPLASASRFQEIEAAYRYLQDKFSKQRWESLNVGGEYGLYHSDNKPGAEIPKEYDIKHTAPQHRQYLSFDGVGTGTPVQRQKQYQKYRAAVAIDSVYDHRVNKIRAESGEDSSLIAKDKREAKKIKTRYGMERLVEDLIQESMARGEFDNLSGKGKPLPQTTDNPYVDFVTHKINQVLIDNGFVPEWISLQKEITEELNYIQNTLAKGREMLGLCPLTTEEEMQWKDCIHKAQPFVNVLNSKINKYNLVVPLMQKQMLLIKIEKEADRILTNGKARVGPVQDPSNMSQKGKSVQTADNSTGLFSLISSFFH